MSVRINERGIIFLAKTVLGFASNVGIEKAQATLSNHPQVFLDLLGKEHLDRKGSRSMKHISSSSWTKKNAEKNLKTLKLTNYQSLILKTIAKNTEPTTLQELEEEFKKEGIEVKTGSMIGGSLAGITKKCESYNVPSIFTTDYTNGTTKYDLIPEVREVIPQLLN